MKSNNFFVEMKKEKIFSVALFALCLLFCGCQRDKDSSVFTAITQGFNGMKDYMGDNVVYWSNGDAIRINDGTYPVAVDGGARHRATVDAEGVSAYGGSYYAAYPANISSVAANGRITFDIPANEIYDETGGNQIVHNVMAAKASDDKLLFQNLCALLHFKVGASGSGVGAKLYAIEVESDQPLWGTMTVEYNESRSEWEMVSLTASSATTRTLKFQSPVELSATVRDFYMIVPPVTGASNFILRFLVEDAGGTVKVFEKSKSGDFSFGMGHIYNFRDVNTYTGAKMMYGSNDVSANTMDGSEEHPYLVLSGTSWDALKTTSIMGTADKRITLAGDIAVSSTYGSEFKATLDGGGHTVTLTTRNISLLSSVNGGQIRNLTIAATEPVTSPVLVVNGSARFYGALAGRANSGSVIENCVNKVNITSDTNLTTVFVGGLCGNADGCTITNCRNEGNITSNALYVGGIAGQSNGMTGCSNSGSITINSSADAVKTQYCGGVTGYIINAPISNCHNTGAIAILKKSSNTVNYGGVCGLSNVNVTGCYNTGSISNTASGGSKYIGGIVGCNLNGTDVLMLNCYNEGDITSADGYARGLLGYDKKMSLKNSYACCDLQGSNVSGIVAYGTDLFDNVNISNCYYYGTITSSNKYGIAGVSGSYKFLIDHCYYPSDFSLCHSSSTDNGDNATLGSAVSLSGGDGTSLREALNNYNAVWPTGWLRWKNGTSPARVVFDN